MSKKKIYISYSWEEEENKNWVVRLRNDLIDENLEIIFDQDELDKGTVNIDRFISDNMSDADYIVIVVTPSYINKSNIKNDGIGNRERCWVEIENDYIINRKHNNSKSLIPIIMKKKRDNILPDNIVGLTYYDMSNEELYIKELQRIRDIIHSEDTKTNKPLITRVFHTSSSSDLTIDIIFTFRDNPPQVSAVVQYGEASIYLDHNQVMSLFLMVSKYKNCKNEDTSDKVLSTEYFNLPIRLNQYTKVIDKIEQGVNEYLKRVIDYEALFEVDKFELIDDSYSYKLLSVKRSNWNTLINVANEYDWDNGKTDWNIFQRNDYYIHVFSPIISHNKKYNSGEHAIYRVKKNEGINNVQ